MSAIDTVREFTKIFDVRHKHAGTVAAATGTPVVMWLCWVLGYIPEPPTLISLLAGVSIGSLVGWLNNLSDDESDSK